MTHTAEWRIRLYLFEKDRTTKARVVLDTGTTVVTGQGVAHCSPVDGAVPEIGDELSASRALQDLGRQLMIAAYGDMEALHGPTAGARTDSHDAGAAARRGRRRPSPGRSAD
ncbi:dsRBD fold-containing protein [Streptomyces sp. O3]